MEAVVTMAAREHSTPTIMDSWNNLVFLIHEPDRHGHLVWFVRLAVGDLTPWRFGPFDSKREAVSVMNRLSESVEDALGDVPGEIVGAVRCGFAQEF